MIKTSLYLSINEPKWESALSDNISKTAEETVNSAVNFVYQKEPLDFLSSEKELSFNLCLSNDKEVHTLNKEFRGIDKPTNVLSFANIDDADFIKYRNGRYDYRFRNNAKRSRNQKNISS